MGWRVMEMRWIWIDAMYMHYSHGVWMSLGFGGDFFFNEWELSSGPGRTMALGFDFWGFDSSCGSVHKVCAARLSLHSSFDI